MHSTHEHTNSDALEATLRPQIEGEIREELEAAFQEQLAVFLSGIGHLDADSVFAGVNANHPRAQMRAERRHQDTLDRRVEQLVEARLEQVMERMRARTADGACAASSDQDVPHGAGTSLPLAPMQGRPCGYSSNERLQP